MKTQFKTKMKIKIMLLLVGLVNINGSNRVAWSNLFKNTTNSFKTNCSGIPNRIGDGNNTT